MVVEVASVFAVVAVGVGTSLSLAVAEEVRFFLFRPLDFARGVLGLLLMLLLLPPALEFSILLSSILADLFSSKVSFVSFPSIVFVSTI